MDGTGGEKHGPASCHVSFSIFASFSLADLDIFRGEGTKHTNNCTVSDGHKFLLSSVSLSYCTYDMLCAGIICYLLTHRCHNNYIFHSPTDDWSLLCKQDSIVWTD